MKSIAQRAKNIMLHLQKKKMIRPKIGEKKRKKK